MEPGCRREAATAALSERASRRPPIRSGRDRHRARRAPSPRGQDGSRHAPGSEARLRWPGLDSAASPGWGRRVRSVWRVAWRLPATWMTRGHPKTGRSRGPVQRSLSTRARRPHQAKPRVAPQEVCCSDPTACRKRGRERSNLPDYRPKMPLHPYLNHRSGTRSRRKRAEDEKSCDFRLPLPFPLCSPDGLSPPRRRQPGRHPSNACIGLGLARS